jgi:hypothetical protein
MKLVCEALNNNVRYALACRDVIKRPVLGMLLQPRASLLRHDKLKRIGHFSFMPCHLRHSPRYYT